MTRFALKIVIALAAAFSLILVLLGVLVWLLLRPEVTPLDRLTEHSTPAPSFSDPISVTFLEDDPDVYAERIDALFDRAEFGDWEKEAQAALANTARFSDGQTMAEIFFNEFDESLYGWTSNTPARAREFVADWKRLHKHSEAARIAEIYVHIDDAWAERGGGYAHKVTEEGWEGFAAYMDKAAAAYYACLQDGIDYPIVYGLGLRIALGQGWSQAEAEEVFLAGFEKDPLCRTLYRHMAFFLLPKWYGSNEAAEEFFYQSRDLARPYAGGAMGFYVACYFDHQLGRNSPDFEFRIPWEDLEPAYRDFATVFPDAIEYHNRMALFACTYGMKDYASDLFQTAAATHDPYVWAEKTYHGWREWAVNNAAPPLFTDLHQAALDNDVDAIERILAEGVDIEHVDGYGLTALFYAVRDDQRDAAIALLDAGADPNAIVDGENHTILWRAIQYKKKGMAELLVTRGGDLLAEYQEGQPLFLMLFYRDMADVAEKAVREYGMDVNLPNDTGFTALHIAASRGELDTVKRLLELGAELNARTDTGGTPLLSAADNAMEDTALYLIERGADVNLSGETGWSPLMGAADNNSTKLAEALLEHGADVMARDHTGWTAPHMAVMDGNLAMLKILLAAPGADMDVVTDEQRTLIHQAAKSGHPEIVSYLVELGAPLNPRTDVGKTPLDYAIEEDKTEAAELLRSLGAKRGTPVETASPSE